jgi:hypothetical protein
MTAVVVFGLGMTTNAQESTVATARLASAPLNNYEDAPATPDADDPAVWVNRLRPSHR